MQPVKYETNEPDDFPGAYRVNGYDGIACWVMGHEVEADEDTEWTGIYNRTGNLVVRMVGDDSNFVVDPDDVTPLKRSEYCGTCGQIGCGCDAYDGEEDDDG